MKLVDHRAGQYRAELFEELVRLILVKMYPDAGIVQDYVPPTHVPTRRSIDFCIDVPGLRIFVEAKASYGTDPLASLRASLRALRLFVGDIPLGAGPSRLILALASGIPQGGNTEIEAVRKAFLQAAAGTGVFFEVWDATEILKLTESLLGKRLSSLSAEQMLSVVGDVKEAASRQSALPEGRHKRVIVLMADFCSYSAFVRASEGDVDLISSIMGRLYRESRRVVLEYGRVLDKFMGDGLLAFWLPDRKVKSDPGQRLMDCATRLTGMATKLAEEWQQRVDDHVAPVGMRCGAAVGDVLFIAEDPLNPALVHAIGDAINLAARLQSSADPNSLVVSNRLHTSYFRDASELVEFNPDAKNMGTKKAWKKTFA